MSGSKLFGNLSGRPCPCVTSGAEDKIKQAECTLNVFFFSP